MAPTLMSGCALWGQGEHRDSDSAFRTDRTEYEPGEAVVLTLHNVFDYAIGYNLCSSQLYRDTDGSWSMVPEDRICTRELRILQPGGTDSFRVTLPENAPEGTYRYTTSAGAAGPDAPPDADRRLSTNTFEVDR